MGVSEKSGIGKERWTGKGKGSEGIAFKFRDFGHRSKGVKCRFLQKLHDGGYEQAGRGGARAVHLSGIRKARLVATRKSNVIGTLPA